jgi:muramidase (phage lysozyme)
MHPHPCRLLAALAALAVPGPAEAQLGGVGLGWLAGGAVAGRAAPGTARAPGAAFAAEMVRPRPGAGRARIAAALRDLIAAAEAGPKGYDAIHFSARDLPAKPPSQMTLAEIRDWIAATPGQQHAIGRYQVIPKTLEMLVARLALPDHARFDPALQDRLADSLIDDAGLGALMAGELDAAAFMDGLARIWAGLPLGNGQSAYQGVAGNRATIARAAFEARIAVILGG